MIYISKLLGCLNLVKNKTYTIVMKMLSNVQNFIFTNFSTFWPHPLVWKNRIIDKPMTEDDIKAKHKCEHLQYTTYSILWNQWKKFLVVLLQCHWHGGGGGCSFISKLTFTRQYSSGFHSSKILKWCYWLLFWENIRQQPPQVQNLPPWPAHKLCIWLSDF